MKKCYILGKKIGIKAMSRLTLKDQNKPITIIMCAKQIIQLSKSENHYMTIFVGFINAGYRYFEKIRQGRTVQSL